VGLTDADHSGPARVVARSVLAIAKEHQLSKSSQYLATIHRLSIEAERLRLALEAVVLRFGNPDGVEDPTITNARKVLDAT